MTHAFPQETIELIKKDIKKVKKPFDFFSSYINLISLSSNLNFYGFGDHLRTGEYAPYRHEMEEMDIQTYNCTTIIPTIFLYAEFLGLNPRIIKFMGMADYAEKADEKPRIEEDAGHYGLLIEHDVDYLCDPFWNVFAPVASIDLNTNCSAGTVRSGQIILSGKNHEYLRTKKRIFKKWKLCSPEEFAAMMDRLKDSAESLDMLVSGQNYDRLNINSSPCSFNIYYDDETNTVTTRLYIPQPEISDKAVLCHQKLNDEGGVETVNYEFYFAEDRTWAKLIGGKRIAKTSSEALQAGVNGKNELLVVIDLLLDNFLGEEIKSIRPQILARSLYAVALKGKNYVYTLDEHDEFLKKKLREITEQKKRELDCELKISLHSSSLEKMMESTAEEIRSLRDRTRAAREENDLLTAKLAYLRESDFRLYRQNRDLVLFSQRELAGLSPEQLEAKAAEAKLDQIVDGFNWTFGYSEMLCDFMNYLLPEVMDKLLLKEYMGSINEKVRARRAKKLENPTKRR